MWGHVPFFTLLQIAQPRYGPVPRRRHRLSGVCAFEIGFVLACLLGWLVAWVPSPFFACCFVLVVLLAASLFFEGLAVSVFGRALAFDLCCDFFTFRMALACGLGVFVCFAKCVVRKEEIKRIALPDSLLPTHFAM